MDIPYKSRSPLPAAPGSEKGSEAGFHNRKNEVAKVGGLLYIEITKSFAEDRKWYQ